MKLWLFLPAATFYPRIWPLRWRRRLKTQVSPNIRREFCLHDLKLKDRRRWSVSSPLVGSLLWSLLFGLNVFFFDAWLWLCSLHFFNWKLMNFHIIQAWVRQMAARHVILMGWKSWLEFDRLTRLNPPFPCTYLTVSTLKFPSAKEKPRFSVRGRPKPNVSTESVSVRRRAMTKRRAHRVKLEEQSQPQIEREADRHGESDAEQTDTLFACSRRWSRRGGKRGTGAPQGSEEPAAPGPVGGGWEDKSGGESTTYITHLKTG